MPSLYERVHGTPAPARKPILAVEPPKPQLQPVKSSWVRNAEAGILPAKDMGPA